jgi:hypothetical protein
LQRLVVSGGSIKGEWVLGMSYAALLAWVAISEGWWRQQKITEVDMLLDAGGEGGDGVWGRMARWRSNWLCFALVFVVLN